MPTIQKTTYHCVRRIFARVVKLYFQGVYREAAALAAFVGADFWIFLTDVLQRLPAMSSHLWLLFQCSRLGTCCVGATSACIRGASNCVRYQYGELPSRSDNTPGDIRKM